MIGVFITGCVGFVSTIISGWTTWFFARKKYNSEVEGNHIQNMKDALAFYEKLSEDNQKRLEEVLKRNSELEEEVKELRKQVLNLMNSICVDLTCQLRKTTLNYKSNEINSRQKMENAELHNQ